MKVKSLLKILESCDPEAVVVLSSDEEGNNYDEAEGVDTNCTWNRKFREIGLKTLTPELKNNGFTEEDVKRGIPCVVISP